ncbi:hypothetical protein AAW00_06050 [Aurantiacibacter luteus]|uniref:HTH arsR-type domain-containing protein n=1 Tax=Aurantiacibacter luteus TaxID=1581420 RepID=A0A0G9MZP2_9SPHN|nr:hypothetical protein AAW00_06050 [Aurantiacibacter luteus]
MAADERFAGVHEASKLLKSLANESRLQILCLLCEGELSVGELCSHIPLSQSALSQHLALLRAEGLVTTRRDAQFVLYSLASPEARAVIETLHGLFCSAEARAKG